MAEDNMSPESQPIGNVPKIKIDNSFKLTGKDIDRMRTIDVPGGGTQLEHLGEKSPFPRPPYPTEINYANVTEIGEEELARLRANGQLEYQGARSLIPRAPSVFKRIVILVERLKMRTGKPQENAAEDVNKITRQYEAAGPSEQSAMLDEALRSAVRMKEVVPASEKNQKR